MKKKITLKDRAKIRAEIRAESKKKKLQKEDGLGPYEIKKIREALRVVWHRSLARKLVVKRCTDEKGFTRCEKCKKRTPAFKVDHIKNCGDVDDGYIKRLFVPSKYLQGLCKECHEPKTQSERKRPKKLTYESVGNVKEAIKNLRRPHDWGF